MNTEAAITEPVTLPVLPEPMVSGVFFSHAQLLAYARQAVYDDRAAAVAVRAPRPFDAGEEVRAWNDWIAGKRGVSQQLPQDASREAWLARASRGA